MTSRRVLFLIPAIIVVTIIFAAGAIFLSVQPEDVQTPVSAAIVPVTVSHAGSQADIHGRFTRQAGATVVKREIDSDGSTSMLYFGIILGALIIMELMLVVEVVAQKRRVRIKQENDYLAEKQAEEYRGLILGKMDFLVDRYSHMVDVSGEARSRSEQLYLSQGPRK